MHPSYQTDNIFKQRQSANVYYVMAETLEDIARPMLTLTDLMERKNNDKSTTNGNWASINNWNHFISIESTMFMPYNLFSVIAIVWSRKWVPFVLSWSIYNLFFYFDRLQDVQLWSKLQATPMVF